MPERHSFDVNWITRHYSSPTKIFLGKEHAFRPYELRILSAASILTPGSGGLKCSVAKGGWIEPHMFDIPTIDFTHAVRILESESLLTVSYFASDGTHRNPIPASDGTNPTINECELHITPKGEMEYRYILIERDRQIRHYWATVVGSAIGMVFMIIGSLIVAAIVHRFWPGK